MKRIKMNQKTHSGHNRYASKRKRKGKRERERKKEEGDIGGANKSLVSSAKKLTGDEK